MPAIIGPVQIVNVTSGGVAHFGDAVIISPKESSKTINGSGASNNGGFVITNNLFNANSILDANLVDQPLIGNF